jgi:hypothetical protein
VANGAAGESMVVRGAAAVARQARTFSARDPVRTTGARERSRGNRRGAAWTAACFGFTVTPGKTVEIDVVTNPNCLRQLDLAVLND